MYSFGELKNHVKRLQDLNKSMNITQRIKWAKTAIDEKEIKNQPVEFYLRIIHYALTQYSPDFYKKVLDIIPNIKTLTDQKFVESTLNIGRKVFNMNPKISVQQFLQVNKLVEKKLEFIVDLCENIYQWQSQIEKKPKRQFKMQNPVKLSPRNTFDDEDEDEDQEIEERRIDIKPTIIDQNLSGSFGHPKFCPAKVQSRKQTSKFDFQDKQTISMAKGRPNVFPKALKNSYAEDQEEDERDFVSTSTKQNMIVHQPKPQHIQNIQSPPKSQDSGNDPVTRQELNQVLHMMSTLNATINNLVSKFNNLQTYVNTQTTKTSARLSLLEQNVKIIKNNL